MPADLHDVTIFGPSFGEKEAVVVIRHNANAERLKTLVSLNETYRSQVVGGNEIHIWDDKGKTMRAGFAKDGRLVIGQSQDAMVAALDTIGGKLDPMKNEVLAPKANDAGVLLFVAGDQVQELVKDRAQSPLVKQMRSAWLTVGEAKDGLKVASTVETEDEKSAADIKQAMDGLKTVVSFAAQDDPDAMLLSDAIVDLSATAEGKTVKVDWPITNQMIGQVLERVTGEIERRAN
jgi:hypothetical protein